MRALRLVLLADGSGDRALIPILIWAMRSAAPDSSFFDPAFEVRAGQLSDEVQRVARTLRPDILFVHRDAESMSLEVRRGEIPVARGGIVRVVPVRMTEAWLLIDANAIRKAAGNPNGRIPLDVPGILRLEGVPDPKETLRKLLLDASEHTGKRRKQRFKRDIGHRVHLVALYTSDFTPLRRLPAFVAFEEDLRLALAVLRLSN